MISAGFKLNAKIILPNLPAETKEISPRTKELSAMPLLWHCALKVWPEPFPVLARYGTCRMRVRSSFSKIARGKDLLPEWKRRALEDVGVEGDIPNMSGSWPKGVILHIRIWKLNREEINRAPNDLEQLPSHHHKQTQHYKEHG